MDWGRWLRHVFATRTALRRAFPVDALDAIEQAITASERHHSGEIRFAIEGSLEPGDAWGGKPPRARALEVFAALGVWDTAANNGVLVYVLLADRVVEIVADRGFNDCVTAAEWRTVCDDMEREFRAGRFREGALVGVEDAGRIVARCFPQQPGQRDEDELPNRPTLL
jgi:uncharacterized membrane protein YgcG